MLLAALVVAGCGAVPGGPSGGTTPTPSPGPTGRFDVTATELDHAVTMHVGQTLEVVLHAGTGMNSWAHPTSSNGAVLQPIVDTGATSVRGVTLAAFRAVAPGEVSVTAYAGPVCPSGAMCPAYVMLYSLSVTVVA